MADEATDSTVNVEDVTKNDLYMSPHEAQVFDRYQQNNGAYGGGDGTLNQNDYFPGYENGGHGSYSGSVVGNIPLFGGGGALVPMGMYDARDMAIRRAAVAKAKEVEDFRKSQKAPTSKLVNINDHLSNEYIDYQQKSWDRALQLSGGDPSKATYMLKNDPEYKKKTQSYENMAKLGDDIVAKTAQDEVDERSGNFTPTPRYKELRGRLYKAIDPSHPEFKNLATVYRTMQMERDFSHAVEQVTKKAFADEHGLTGMDLNDPEFIKVYNGSVKEYSPEQIEGFAQVLNDSFYQGSDYWTPDKVKKDLANMLRGKVKTNKVSVQQKRDESGDDPDYTVEDIVDDATDINGNVISKAQPVKNAKGETTAETTQRKTTFRTFDRLTFKTPVKAVIPITKKAVDLTNGTVPADNIGNVEAQIGGIYNTFTVNKKGDPMDGMMVDADNVDKYQGQENNLVVTPMVSVKYKNGDEDVSVEMPLSEVKTALLGTKGKNKAVIEEIESRAEAKTTELKSKSKPAKAAKKDPLGLGL